MQANRDQAERAGADRRQDVRRAGAGKTRPPGEGFLPIPRSSIRPVAFLHLERADYAIDAAGTRAPDYKNGHLRRVTELDGSVVEYDYQLAFDRLWRAYRSGTYAVNYQYDYDLNNNRTSVMVNGGTPTTATYDAANQLNNSGGTGYGYDRNGNLISFGANTLGYDESNEWVSGTVNGNTLAFSYDGQGRRASRTVGTGRTDY